MEAAALAAAKGSAFLPAVLFFGVVAAAPELTASSLFTALAAAGVLRRALPVVVELRARGVRFLGVSASSVVLDESASTAAAGVAALAAGDGVDALLLSVVKRKVTVPASSSTMAFLVIGVDSLSPVEADDLMLRDLLLFLAFEGSTDIALALSELLLTTGLGAAY